MSLFQFQNNCVDQLKNLEKGIKHNSVFVISNRLGLLLPHYTGKRKIILEYLKSSLKGAINLQGFYQRPETCVGSILNDIQLPTLIITASFNLIFWIKLIPPQQYIIINSGTTFAEKIIYIHINFMKKSEDVNRIFLELYLIKKLQISFCQLHINISMSDDIDDMRDVNPQAIIRYDICEEILTCLPDKQFVYYKLYCGGHENYTENYSGVRDALHLIDCENPNYELFCKKMNIHICYTENEVKTYFDKIIKDILNDNSKFSKNFITAMLLHTMGEAQVIEKKLCV